jgi:hypothetical protein
MFNPLWTAKVWFPRYVPSLITSRHQKDIERTTNAKADIKKNSPLVKACIVDTPLVVKVNSAIDVYIGQGDGDTKWKGCAWNTLLVKFVIYLNHHKSNLITHIYITYLWYIF